MKSNFNFRNKILFFVIFLFSLTFIIKLFLVQVVHGDFYAEEANRQYATPSSNIFERGTIFFTEKGGTLVSAGMQTSGFKLAIDPTKISNPDEVFDKISEIIPLDEESFKMRAGKKNDVYEEVADKLTQAQADAISKLGIKGVSLFKQKWRFYPGDNLAAHSLGFVAYKGDELAGRYGLERQYEEVLSRGKNNPYVNFFAEVFSNINQTFFSDEEKAGDIITTIEPSVQAFLEGSLEKVKNRYNADSIGAIIMSPKTGAIYAMSVKEDFNLNQFSKVKNASTYSNPLVENVLEFGSIVKPLVMASAIDAGVANANTRYEDKGSIIVEKKEIFNFDKKARGWVDMQDVLNQSLNTGMVFMQQKLGKDRLREYLFSFGIKEKTGIDLPNETSGLTSNLNSPREIEYANASFGQGIALTPVEMIRALAALGNGGKLVTPHLVREIKYEDGTSRKPEHPITQSKISPETSEAVTRMLVTVMDEALKNGNAKMEHHSIAIKTGTAQVAKEEGGGYYTDRNTHSFFGYFPAYDPEFIVLLYAVNPKGVEFAAQTWADPFLDISKFLLNYYQVPPDR